MAQLDFSLRLGSWRGVSVRLHPALLAVVIGAVVWSSTRPALSVAGNMTPITLVTLASLLASVLAHEWGHWLAARRSGVRVRQIVLSPIGDISHEFAFTAPRQALLWAAAGPGVNLIICGACMLVLSGVEPGLEWSALLHPMRPAWQTGVGITIEQVLRILIWVNWLLCLVNCLPAFPFDGGRATRAMIQSIWPNVRRGRVTDMVFAVGVASAIGVFMGAAIVGRSQVDAVYPTWWGLIVVAAAMLIGSVREVRKQDAGIESESTGDDDAAISATRPSKALVRSSDYYVPGSQSANWSVPNEHLVDIEQQDDLMLDEILRRVHAEGIDSLTTAERDVLNRISTRYRRRLHKTDEE